MKIYAPVKDTNGVYASVRFVNGVGETDNPRLIEWFRSHGYKVPIDDSFEKCVDSSQISYEKCDEIIDTPITNESEFVGINELVNDEPDFDSMTPIELREWATANGLGMKIKNTRNKEKLLEIIRG